MKGAPVIVLTVFLAAAAFQVGYANPLRKDSSENTASVYILGNLNNMAVSQSYSKSQAAQDRNESEWNNTELMSGSEKKSKNERAKPPNQGRVLIYAGGDASNVAIAHEGSEAQAAENDQKSGYNSQNLALNAASEEYDEEEEYYDEDGKKKKISKQL